MGSVSVRLWVDDKLETLEEHGVILHHSMRPTFMAYSQARGPVPKGTGPFLD